MSAEPLPRDPAEPKTAPEDVAQGAVEKGGLPGVQLLAKPGRRSLLAVPHAAAMLAVEDPEGCLAALWNLVKAQRGTKGRRVRRVDFIFDDGRWVFIDVATAVRHGRQRG